MEFVAPKTFAEYIEVFPDYHRKWLTRHCPWLLSSPEDYEDAAQYLMLRTIHSQRVEKYDVFQRRKRGQKDTPGLFLHWMGQCFKNDIRSLVSDGKRTKRRVNENTASLEDFIHTSNSSNEGVADSDTLSFASHGYAKRAEREGELIIVQAQIAEFRSFVAEYRPDLLPALDNLAAASVAQKSSLILLANHMAKGKRPSRRRKPYPQRRQGRPSFEYTKEQVNALAEEGLSIREAKAALGCSHQTLQNVARKHFGLSWKTLVQVKQSQKEAVA